MALGEGMAVDCATQCCRITLAFQSVEVRCCLPVLIRVLDDGVRRALFDVERYQRDQLKRWKLHCRILILRNPMRE